MLPYLLSTNPQSITAIDLSDKMLNVAKKKYSDNRISFVNEDILKFREDGFDYAILYSVYPHFDHKDILFKHISSLLLKGGKIIIAHSESKEKINQVHGGNEPVKDDVLAPGCVTAETMSKYFEVLTIIDDSEMYYVDGVNL